MHSHRQTAQRAAVGWPGRCAAWRAWTVRASGDAVTRMQEHSMPGSETAWRRTCWAVEEHVDVGGVARNTNSAAQMDGITARTRAKWMEKRGRDGEIGEGRRRKEEEREKRRRMHGKGKRRYNGQALLAQGPLRCDTGEDDALRSQSSDEASGPSWPSPAALCLFLPFQARQRGPDLAPV